MIIFWKKKLVTHLKENTYKGGNLVVGTPTTYQVQESIQQCPCLARPIRTPYPRCRSKRLLEPIASFSGL